MLVSLPCFSRYGPRWVGARCSWRFEARRAVQDVYFGALVDFRKLWSRQNMQVEDVERSQEQVSYVQRNRGK